MWTWEWYRYEEIWAAIQGNGTVKLESLLKGKEWPTAALFDKDGNHTMLHTAAALGHVESLMVIIEHTDAKPDILNSNLATPLHFACRNNHDMAAKFLIGWGVDVNIQDEHGQTWLLICWIHGHKRLAQILIDSSVAGDTPEPLDVDLKDYRGLTPLNWASIKGDINFIKMLYEKGGAKIDEASPKGWTPLLYAARGGYCEIVQYLLEKGANSLQQDNSGGTVAHHAIEKGQGDIIEVLIEYSVDIDITDNAGRTPLFEAIENNKITVSRLLVTNGARVDITDYSGHTPLYCAARDGNEQILKILIDIGKAKVDHFGKNSNLKDPNEELEYENEDEKLIMEGLEASKTPLHVASLLGYKPIVSYLVTNGADPNIAGDQGMNALHFSIIGKQPEITQYLLTNTAVDYTTKDSSGRDASDLVQEMLPIYFPHYEKLISSLPSERIGSKFNSDIGVVATHYHNPEDDRQIKGVQNNDELNKIYQEAKHDNEPKEDKNKRLFDMEEDDIRLEKDKEPDVIIERVFGMKTALGVISISWKFREEALKHIIKNIPNKLESDMDFLDTIKAWSTVCNLTVQDKVMKVFNAWVAIFNQLVSNTKLEEKGIDVFVRNVAEYELISKLLERSEEGNARISSKAQEALIDFSFHPSIGEGFVSTYIISRLESHYKNSNTKGTGVMLNLLYKFITSFGINKRSSPLSPKKILKVVIPPLFHKDKEIRDISLKILLEVHSKTGLINESLFKDLNIPSTSQSIIDNILKAISEVKVDKVQKSEIEFDDDESPSGTGDIGDLQDKGKSKDWAQREIALKRIKEELKDNEDCVIDQNFSETWVELLSSCLEENNISIYLVAIDVVSFFFNRWLMRNYDVLISNIDALIQPICLRTNDTNTRVRKKSIEVILELWDNSFNNINQKYSSYMQDSDSSISCKIADMLMNSKLGEKAILGRLSVYAKRIQDLANSSNDDRSEMTSKPHQVLLGSNYAIITEFAVQWCLHKNTKVRQQALRLIVDICRYNVKDPNGNSFKQKIVNYILGLKPSLRDPLITKVNSVWKSTYINAEELGIDLAVRSNNRMARSKSKDRAGDLSSFKRSASMPRSNLPEINSNNVETNPIIVLPYYEPIKDNIALKHQNLINLFNKDIIGCFVSQTWSTRQAALEKIIEQLPNLDENTKDPMKCEINQFNLPMDECFAGFCKLILEGIKDPVLKIYLSILELMQKGLPIFFRRLTKHELNSSLLDSIIREILRKTSELKLKLRVASKNMCIYLSHQSPIGPEKMTNLTIEALEQMIEINDKGNNSGKKSKNKPGSAMIDQNEAQSSLCNSTMWTSCVSLLIEYQRQAKLASKVNDAFTEKFMYIINCSLRHHTPAVRKEAELLFIELYKTLGHNIETQLVDQKQALVDKLILTAKKESGVIVKSDNQLEEEKKAKDHYITSKVKSDYLPDIIIKMFGSETIDELKSANPKKRLKALVDIKKMFLKATVNMNSKRARELSEPITHLMRLILSDENTDVYLEALKIVKFIIAALSGHLESLDLHILIGSFLGTIVTNTVNSNVRIQVASDKVVIYFAKHNNIGPFVIARDILKNVDKISFAIERSGHKRKETFSEKKPFVTRFLSILLLLVNQFSIVLCYNGSNDENQDSLGNNVNFSLKSGSEAKPSGIPLKLYETDFNDKLVKWLAQLLENSDSDLNIKSLASQILSSLQSIDSKTLDFSINKLDPIKKAPLKKIMIELEAMKKNGKSVLGDNKNQLTNSDMTSHTPPFRMSPSERNTSSRTSLFSGNGQGYNAGRSVYESSDGMRSSDGFKSELRNSRRLLQKKGSGFDYSASKPTNPPVVGVGGVERNFTERKMPVGSLRRSNQHSNSGISKFSLPDVGVPKNDNVLPPIAGTGMMSSYEPSAISSIKPPRNRKLGKSQREYPFTDSMNKPPLYTKQNQTQRDGSKFNDEGMGGNRYGTISYTQMDFNRVRNDMNSSTGLSSNKNTIKTSTTLPQATFEVSTTNYNESKPRKRDFLDK